jgi:hypothetical protein
MYWQEPGDGAPERTGVTEPVHHRRPRIGAPRDSEFRVSCRDAVPALPASAPSGAWRQQAGTRPHGESMRGRSVRPAG